MNKVLRIYKTDRGIWHIEFERNGAVYYSSLHTRDEHEAKRKLEHYERVIAAKGTPA